MSTNTKTKQELPPIASASDLPAVAVRQGGLTAIFRAVKDLILPPPSEKNISKITTAVHQTWHAGCPNYTLQKHVVIRKEGQAWQPVEHVRKISAGNNIDQDDYRKIKFLALSTIHEALDFAEKWEIEHIRNEMPIWGIPIDQKAWRSMLPNTHWSKLRPWVTSEKTLIEADGLEGLDKYECSRIKNDFQIKPK